MSTHLPVVRVTIDTLERSAPAMLRRRGPRTLIGYNATATRLDVTEWLVCNLTKDEVRIVLAAYGLKFPLPNWTTNRRPVMLWVPPALRLPGADALQGGAELERRRALGDLHLESAALHTELTGCPHDLQTVADLTAA